MPRPKHLRADTVSMNEILLYDTSQVEADFYLQTHSTNPLLRPETISRAIRTFLADYPAHDFALLGHTPADPSVGPGRPRPQPRPGRPAPDPGPAAGLRREFLPVHLHPREPGPAAQPPGRAPADVRDGCG